MNGKDVRRGRNIGLDLYKVLCMLLVVMTHYSDHGKTPLTASDPLTFNWFLLAAARIGPFILGAFMLITGYFLSMKTKFSWRSFFKLYGQVLFYSVATGIAACLLGTKEMSLLNVVKMVLPFSFNRYWYFSAYIVILLLHPFINKLIDSLTKKQLAALCVVSLVLFSVIRTVTAAEWLQGTNRLYLFITMYFVGAYIRKYDIRLSKKQSGLIAVALIVAELVSLIVMKYVAQIIHKDNVISYFVWNAEKILPVALSISLFLFFKQLNIKNQAVIRCIEFLSPSLFGVYLLHIGDLHVWLFEQVFDNSVLYKTGSILPQMLLATVTIFCAGIIVDKIRCLILEKPLLRLTEGTIRKLDEKTNALLQ